MMIDQATIQAKLWRVIARAQALKPLEDEAMIAQASSPAGNSVGLFTQDFGMNRWDWPQGVGLYGMHKLYEITGETYLIQYLKQWYKGHIEQGLPKRNINTTAPMLTLANLCSAGEMGQDGIDLCSDWADWLMDVLPRTMEGGFQHTTTKNAMHGTVELHEGELWVDTLFMAVLFLTQMGVQTGNRRYIQEAVSQYLIHIKYLFNKRERLMYHGWSFNHNNNFGGIFWGRGNCWFTCATADWLEMLGDKLDASVRQHVTNTWLAQVQTLAQLQAPSGLWHTVLDDPTSYLEVSGSAGIAYGILKGIRIGLLPQSYYACAQRAIEGILQNIDQDGSVLNVSAGTGMGNNPEHYKNILCLPMAYGQSLTALALTEAVRMGEPDA